MKLAFPGIFYKSRERIYRQASKHKNSAEDFSRKGKDQKKGDKDWKKKKKINAVIFIVGILSRQEANRGKFWAKEKIRDSSYKFSIGETSDSESEHRDHAYLQVFWTLPLWWSLNH